MREHAAPPAAAGAVRRFATALLGLALLGALSGLDAGTRAVPSAGAQAPAAWIGVEMPAAGDDGGAGLAASAAVQLAVGPGRMVRRDSSNGGFLNPHRDEGSDNDVDRRVAPAIVAAYASDPRIVAMIGGLRRNVGDADAAAAEARGLPAILLARWSRTPERLSRTPSGASAFCLCASPRRLVAFARGAARARFGPRLLVVLVGEAGALRAQWPRRFDPVPVARVDASAPAAEAVRRRAAGADAVLVIADERPPALWRSAAFRRWFSGEYVRRLGHRDYLLVPAAARRGDVLALRETIPDGPARRDFARRFREAAGYLPGPEATRAYAAAQILRASGSDRASVRRALRDRRFDTVAGPVRFDTDGYRDGSQLAAAVP
ncbi:MAG: hypothetical protein JWM87_1561 [Candidatus Eremiobacteraeota bacterium]|nr:hypothetical protein [Candidatus Eremiobacteraeota bacterium]